MLQIIEVLLVLVFLIAFISNPSSIGFGLLILAIIFAMAGNLRRTGKL